MNINDLLAGSAGASVALAMAQAGARVALGGFFAISGFHKLFNKARHETMLRTLEADHVPAPGFNSWWVPLNEFGCGLAVIAGLLTVPAACSLATICLVALVTDGFARCRSWNPIDLADWCDDVLYLPETLYLLLAVFLITAGAGSLSIDHLIWR